MKEKKGQILVNNEFKDVTKGQKFGQWWYGVTEPLILKYADFMLKNPKTTKMYVNQNKPKSFPSSIVISTEAACRFIDFIYSDKGANGTARMAVTKCVCQTALKRPKEPQKKDMALLYLADMYTTMKHTGIKEPFELIETAEKAKNMIKYFDECGLMHCVFYCCGSGKWTFVMCNCDNEVCVPYRSYMAGRSEEMSAGPQIAYLDIGKCKGIENCGKCLERCVLDACYEDENKLSGLKSDKCLGCGLCVTTCPTGARTLIEREDYQHEDVLTTKILLGKE